LPVSANLNAVSELRGWDENAGGFPSKKLTVSVQVLIRTERPAGFGM